MTSLFTFHSLLQAAAHELDSFIKVRRITLVGIGLTCRQPPAHLFSEGRAFAHRIFTVRQENPHTILLHRDRYHDIVKPANVVQDVHGPPASASRGYSERKMLQHNLILEVGDTIVDIVKNRAYGSDILQMVATMLAYSCNLDGLDHSYVMRCSLFDEPPQRETTVEEELASRACA